MTKTQFLQRLKEIAPKFRWYLAAGGNLCAQPLKEMSYFPKKGYCPITAVVFAETGGASFSQRRFLNAANVLGMKPLDATKVAMAADVNLPLPLRLKLLDAVGLTPKGA